MCFQKAFDSYSKHTSRHAKTWIQRNNLNWWKTPAESPDLNPIENLWHKLNCFPECFNAINQFFLKPKTEEKLINGIETFWKTVNKEKCARYIQHLRKVTPTVIELNGNATGY